MENKSIASSTKLLSQTVMEGYIDLQQIVYVAGRQDGASSVRLAAVTVGSRNIHFGLEDIPIVSAVSSKQHHPTGDITSFHCCGSGPYHCTSLNE